MMINDKKYAKIVLVGRSACETNPFTNCIDQENFMIFFKCKAWIVHCETLALFKSNTQVYVS